MDDKTALRIKFKNLRKTFDLIYLSGIITEKIRKSEMYKAAKNVMFFYPTKYEIDVRGVLEDSGKQFYLPRVEGDNLLVCPYILGDALVKSEFNIMEPVKNPVSPECLDLIIVPALAVDSKLYRLGYGGGFYDRFLTKNTHAKSLVPICSKQVVENLPHDGFDCPVDFVITE